jgi:uncharacterized oxidoreductase
MPSFALAGRTALVTGGTAGIGLALTHGLVAAGAHRVIVVGRDAERLAAVAAAHPGVVVPARADLSDAADTDRLLARLDAEAPALSLVVNNAGTQRLTDVAGDAITAPDALRTEVLAALRAEIAANLTGVVTLSVGLLPLLARQPSAAIVNVSSGLALAPKRSAPVYCATKAAVRSFTRALRYQCEDRLPHVRVVEALPPLVDTAMTRGRGRGKISAAACAAEILAGLRAGRAEVYVGKSKLLRAVMRVAPAAGYRLMRDA